MNTGPQIAHNTELFHRDVHNATIETAVNTTEEEKQGNKTISIATLLSQQLYKRLVELECQAAAFNLSQINSTNQGNNNSKDATQDSLIQPLNSLMIDQRLFSGDIKLPEFHGNPSEFGSFWELFEELVHKQPFSNIRKLSILLSCCKGDAARCLRMIPRTGDSYEKAIEQLKDQYEDPRRITIHMICQLTSMKPSNNDPRTLCNNLNDIKAIIATIQKQGEMVDNTYMTTLTTSTTTNLPRQQRHTASVSLSKPSITFSTKTKTKHTTKEDEQFPIKGNN
ncbi:hypothetical protein OSTOST_02712 [Ostertagia ostertagi]